MNHVSLRRDLRFLYSSLTQVIERFQWFPTLSISSGGCVISDGNVIVL